MKIKVYVKSLVLLVLLLLICASTGAAQRNKQKAAQQSIWQEVKWERWGLKFSIPADLKETTEIQEEKPIPTDEYFSESKTFEGLSGTKSNASLLELSVGVTNWKGEKLKTEYKGEEVELSPEQMLEIDFIGDTGEVERADSPQTEAKYLEIDGQRGIFVIRNVTPGAGKTVKPDNKIVVIWGTYRVFKGNVQGIVVSLEGKRKELETMKKIINSLKFN